jgi:hypothetical protein
MVFMFGMDGTGAQGLNHLVTARVISQPSLSKKDEEPVISTPAHSLCK